MHSLSFSRALQILSVFIAPLLLLSPRCAFAFVPTSPRNTKTTTAQLIVAQPSLFTRLRVFPEEPPTAKSSSFIAVKLLSSLTQQLPFLLRTVGIVAIGLAVVYTLVAKFGRKWATDEGIDEAIKSERPGLANKVPAEWLRKVYLSSPDLKSDILDKAIERSLFRQVYFETPQMLKKKDPSRWKNFAPLYIAVLKEEYPEYPVLVTAFSFKMDKDTEAALLTILMSKRNMTAFKFMWKVLAHVKARAATGNTLKNRLIGRFL